MHPRPEEAIIRIIERPFSRVLTSNGALIETCLPRERSVQLCSRSFKWGFDICKILTKIPFRETILCALKFWHDVKLSIYTRKQNCPIKMGGSFFFNYFVSKPLKTNVNPKKWYFEGKTKSTSSMFFHSWTNTIVTEIKLSWKTRGLPCIVFICRDLHFQFSL